MVLLEGIEFSESELRIIKILIQKHRDEVTAEYRQMQLEELLDRSLAEDEMMLAGDR